MPWSVGVLAYAPFAGGAASGRGNARGPVCQAESPGLSHAPVAHDVFTCLQARQIATDAEIHKNLAYVAARRQQVRAERRQQSRRQTEQWQMSTTRSCQHQLTISVLREVLPGVGGLSSAMVVVQAGRAQPALCIQQWRRQRLQPGETAPAFCAKSDAKRRVDKR